MGKARFRVTVYCGRCNRKWQRWVSARKAIVHRCENCGGTAVELSDLLARGMKYG